MFSNGIAHEHQKAFVMELCEVAQQSQIIPTATKVVAEYLAKWSECCTGKFCLQ